MESASVTGPSVSTAEALAALDSIADDRRRMADTLRRNARWYAPTYGALVAGMLLAPAAPDEAFPVVVLVGTLAIAGLAMAYWLRTGMWPRPGSPGQKLAMVLVALLVIAGMGVGLAAWRAWDAPVVGLAVAVTIGLAAGALSWGFDHASARALESP